MKKRYLLLGAAAFAVVESLAILYALWPALMRKESVKRYEVRLGVAAIPPLGQAQEAWREFAADFGKDYGCVLKPYFARSTEELSAGLANGSLDLIYTDTANFLELNGRVKLKLWLYHKLPKRELDRLRSVLVCSKPVPYISDSKGLRLTYSGAGSMTGRVVPSRFLEEKLPAKAQDWFSSVETAQGEGVAFARLLAGKTDIVAVCALSLDELASRLDDKQRESMKTLWVSLPLPENVLCALESAPPELAETLSLASAKIASKKLKEEFLTARSMVFLPPDYGFLELKNGLQRFLEGPRASKTKTPVSKERN